MMSVDGLIDSVCVIVMASSLNTEDNVPVGLGKKLSIHKS